MRRLILSFLCLIMLIPAPAVAFERPQLNLPAVTGNPVIQVGDRDRREWRRDRRDRREWRRDNRERRREWREERREARRDWREEPRRDWRRDRRDDRREARRDWRDEPRYEWRRDRRDDRRDWRHHRRNRNNGAEDAAAFLLGMGAGAIVAGALNNNNGYGGQSVIPRPGELIVNEKACNPNGNPIYRDQYGQLRCR